MADCVAGGHLKRDAAVLFADCVAPDGYSGGPMLDAADPHRVVGLLVARQCTGEGLRTLAIDAAAIDLDGGSQPPLAITSGSSPAAGRSPE